MSGHPLLYKVLVFMMTSRLSKTLAALALSGVIAIALLLASLWLEHRAAITLPAPTGPFAVGRALYNWPDNKTSDPMAPEPGTKRDLLVWIWYPAVRGATQAADDYLPAPWRVAVEQHMGALLTNFLTRDLSRVHTHSIRNADVSPERRSYPVVLMRAGLAALTTDYTTLAEDLASHGYVVVGFDAPYRTFVVVLPDGQVIARAPQNNADLVSGAQQEQLAQKLVNSWTADMKFALDQLETLNTSDTSGRFVGRLDMQRVGVFGHSLGGATALQFCHDDPRCKAGIDIDGAPLGSVITEGLHHPFIFVIGDHKGEPDAEVRQVEANIRSIYDRLPPGARSIVEIRGANHFSFSDGALLKSQIALGTLRLLHVVGIDGRRQLAATAYCVHTFFDAYLKSPGISQLNISSPLYPEIHVRAAA
jgi:dienelactone hydrolase